MLSWFAVGLLILLLLVWVFHATIFSYVRTRFFKSPQLPQQQQQQEEDDRDAERLRNDMEQALQQLQYDYDRRFGVPAPDLPD